MDETFELTPPPRRPLPSQAEIDNINAKQLLHSEAGMFTTRPVPVNQQVGVVDTDDMHTFIEREYAVNARNAAEDKAYAQAAAAGAAQDAIDQARQASFNRLTQRQKDYIEIKNSLSGKKLSQLQFDYYNSLIKLSAEELDEVQPFIYQDAASLAAARGAARPSVRAPRAPRRPLPSPSPVSPASRCPGCPCGPAP